MTKKIIAIVVCAIIVFLAGVGAESFVSNKNVRSGDISHITGGLSVGLANSGDTFTAGSGSLPFQVSGSGIVYTGAGLTEGGGTRATTTNNKAEALLASDLSPYNLISVTPGNSSGLTLTLPATSTMTSFLTNSGDSDSIDIYNATTAAAIPMGVLGGSGWNIALVGTTSVNAVSTSTSKRGVHIEMVRLPNTDVLGIVSATQ